MRKKNSRKKKEIKQYKSCESFYKDKPFYLDYGYSPEEWRVKMDVDRGIGNGVNEDGYLSALELVEMATGV